MAIKIDPSNWYRLEGKILPLSEYGKYTSDISSLSGQDIWYTNVELRLQNASSTDYVHGVNYKLRNFEAYGASTIEEIAADYSSLVSTIVTDIHKNEGAITYYEPVAITKSCVICYGDAYGENLDKTLIILRDTWLSDSLIGITAEYEGGSVAQDEELDEDELVVTGIFVDGHESRIMPMNYKIIRLSDNTETKVINKTGTVSFKAVVTYADETWEAGFKVQGVKRLIGITGYYDGPEMPVGKHPAKRYFVISALYSDTSASTVSDWSFYNGDKVTATNGGNLEIYYKGFTCTVYVKHYDTTVTQIKATYTGPDVEKGKDFLEDYLTVKIYSESADHSHGYWETIAPGTYILDTTRISLEGDNIITVTYTTAHGLELSTTFVITGFIAKAKIGYILAEYTGPPIQIGSFYNTNLIEVKVYWTDGSITETKDFTVNSTKIMAIGDNIFTLAHKSKTCTFNVTGITAENTTVSGYRATEVPLKYPEACTDNHRYRGPMESLKFDESAMHEEENITKLFNLYKKLEEEYNNLNKGKETLFGTASLILNSCMQIRDRIRTIKKAGGA